jgi:hypothetical protein
VQHEFPAVSIPSVNELSSVVSKESDVIDLDVPVVGREAAVVAVQKVDGRRYLQEKVNAGLPEHQRRLVIIRLLAGETAQSQQLVD